MKPKKLKIAQLSTPFINVPPKTYGGTELVVYNLTKELVRRGHKVTLFATKNSKTSANLEYAFKKALGLGMMKNLLSGLAQKLSWAHALPSLYHAVLPFEKASQFDIIHNHFHYYGLFFSSLIKTPVLTTYHGDFATAERSRIEKLILEKYKKNFWTAISKSQKNQVKTKLNFLKVIYHGVPIENFPFSQEHQNYLAWLGRITKKKGLLEAIKVAKKTKNKLVIAGTVNPRDREYFRKEIKPKIDNKLIFFIGPVNYQKKVKLLKNAKALLYPISWEEPFGLVMIEALACGCPVIAFNQGSVPEIVKNNETGFIVKNTLEMAGAIKDIDKINRKKCRERVEKNFTIEKMVDGYEKVYQEILSR
ncbi:MAG TPA: glycosyltransferase family 4 protein [Candidatus Nealsonbacteria bacterium]|uniref:Glycosyl transferase family 1 domain-containing protein n=1 Tax=marine sediment metagenome TaxID=412755 RepID=A0A0F9UF55_9ZZZZ|nr:glycosyltransferase family 4 protein [Candidatus Nealsonbacteria bacterium]HEB46674.1 glycosyltransferase family 4 protein [Candidatus Nealsonbacteria bacterium]